MVRCRYRGLPQPSYGAVTLLLLTALIVALPTWLDVGSAAGAAVKLTNGGAGRYFGSDFQLTADGQHVVYIADSDTAGVAELFSVPLDGSETPHKLNAPLPESGDVTRFRLLSDGRHVIYVADQDINDVPELYVQLVNGSMTPSKINAPQTTKFNQLEFEISPDETRVAYRWSNYSPVAQNIYARDIAATESQILVNTGGPQSRGIFRFASNDRVVFQNSDHDLWTGHADQTLLATRLAEDVIHCYSCANPANDSVIFDTRRDLYSVSADGAQSPTHLASHSYESSLYAQLSSDGAWMIYEAGGSLYSVPTDGGRAATHLSAGVSYYLANARIASDNNRVVYKADLDQDEVYEVYSVHLDGSDVPTRIDPQLPGYGSGRYGVLQVSPNSERVVFSYDQGSSTFPTAIYSSPLDGTTPPQKLSTPLRENEYIHDAIISPDSSFVLYATAPLQTDGPPPDPWQDPRILMVPIDGGPVRVVSDPLLPQDYVFGFGLSPDGATLLYSVYKASAGTIDLYAATLFGPGDYNLDGSVNAADYTIWRDHLGNPAGSLPNDVDGGVIGLAQYNTWKANFGTAAGAAAVGRTVPEPAAFGLAVANIIVLCGMRIRSA